MFQKYFSVFAGLCVIASAGCAVAKATQKSSTQAKKKSQIYTFESDSSGFNTKNFFYDNGEEVVVFDTQFTPATAEKSLAELRTKTQNPITYVVVTHPNPDKFNGMNVFQKLGAQVIASSATAQSMQGVHDYKKYYFVNMAKMFTSDTYPQLSKPDIIFNKSYSLKLKNGETIELSELDHAGVSSNQTVADIKLKNTLVVGDLIHHKAHAWLEGGIIQGKPTPNLKGWIADLKQISNQYGSRNPKILGGRGEAASLKIAIPAQIKYLQKADQIVNRYVADLKLRKSELQTDKAGLHHAALQAQFEKAFPDYALSYMIQYGVYGLAQSK